MTHTDTPWVDGLTIPQVLARTAGRFGSHDALVYPELGLRISYNEFADIVHRTAKGLLAIGIGKGDHVAIWSTNLPEWPILQFATASIGAVLVTVNPAYRSAELKYVLEQSDASALFLTDEFKQSNYYDILRDVCPEAFERSDPLQPIRSAGFPKLRHIVALKSNAPNGLLGWQTMVDAGRQLSSERVYRITAGLRPEEPINIQYTSGTTGFPKAAMLSHRNILLNGYYVSGCQNITENDRMCIPVPYYHCFGCVMGTLGAVVRGAAMVIPAEHFDAAATLHAIEQERCTTVYGVPTMFIAMLEHPYFQTKRLTSLRSGIMAGSPCPIEVMRKVITHMGVREITIAYGQTETSPVLTQTRVDDPIELRVETVGRELPGVAVEIRDPNTGQKLPDNTPGELCAKGHGIMIGYYKNPQATAKAITDGWIHTGDLAVRRPDGYYRITGRIKDMIIRGGENIYPLEIEEFFYTHPAVEQVAIVGLPDDKFGEAVCAWIKVREGHTLTEQDVKDFCHEKIAYFKVPKYVTMVSGFPTTVSGKIQKFKIREQMIAELGLTEKETA